MAKTLTFFLLLSVFFPLEGISYLFLKDRLKEANPGDFVVTSQKKTFTLWSIRGRDENQVLIEEISVPSPYLELDETSWKGWVADNAPNHSTWLVYAIDLKSGRLLGLYSFDQAKWCAIDRSTNFLSTLFNLGFTPMPVNQRRRVASSLGYWNPPLIFEGEEVEGVPFDHFQARWPRDGSELAEKWIDIYLPATNTPYPSYFPYWLQVSAHVAQAKIRIVDSGSNLKSPLKIQWPKESYQHPSDNVSSLGSTESGQDKLSTLIDNSSTGSPH